VKKRGRGKVVLNKIRKTYSYDVSEIAKLFGVCKQTVHNWIKAGLPTIDGSYPCLVHGGELYAWHATRKQKNKSPTPFGKFHCFHCKAAQFPADGTLNITNRNRKFARAQAVCAVCGTKVFRNLALRDCDAFANIHRQKQTADTTLFSDEFPSVNWTLKPNSTRKRAPHLAGAGSTVSKPTRDMASPRQEQLSLFE
jgi:hypothetical protein